MKFVKRPNGAGGINGVVTIQGNTCDGCIASWGYDNSPRRMNLQTSCGSATGVAGMCGVDEATHEFGHLLGKFYDDGIGLNND